MYLLILVPVLVIVELIYFRLARSFQIIDKPNERSLHNKPTIRGGGIIFPLALLLFFVINGNISHYFLLAVILLAAVGLADDVKNLSRSVRFGIQVIAMLLIFYDLHVFMHSWWVIILLLIVATGTVNAYNFMDGINGITCGYTFVILGSLFYINNNIIPFVENDLILIMMAGLGVFAFFNFRTKAVCFAGDVGSLTIGFAVIYLVLRLIMVSHNYVFVMFLAVYGTDSVLTIIHRLLLRQNIFKAHRLHLYQVIISQQGVHHLPMTLIYMMVQLIVSTVIIYNLDLPQGSQYVAAIIMLGILGLAYLAAKRRFYKTAGNVL